MQATKVRSHLSARNVKQIFNFNAEDYEDLARIGINLTPREVRRMMAVQHDCGMDSDDTGMDSLQATISPASISAPLQFLQNWLPGWVQVLTRARKIDEIVGITTAGDWEDEQVVQGFIEPTGTAVPYGDKTNVPLADWNVSFLERTIIRFEEGLSVGKLEALRSAKIKVDSANVKRNSASMQLEIQRNAIGFNGYNAGLNYTFGFLNDPNQPAYVSVTNGATSGTTFWSGKKFSDMQTDLRTAFAALRSNSGDNIDPNSASITLVVPTNSIDFLNNTTDFGVSVWDWLKKNYPNCRVVSAPELNASHGGLNVFVMFADTVDDGSSDDNKTFMQIVPVKFQMLGVEQRVKMYVEDYTNATAGVMCKRGFAVVRYFGI
jgi:hypothetical protein